MPLQICQDAQHMQQCQYTNSYTDSTSDYSSPAGLWQFVERFWVKSDAGVVSIILLDSQLCQLSLTWQ